MPLKARIKYAAKAIDYRAMYRNPLRMSLLMALLSSSLLSITTDVVADEGDVYSSFCGNQTAMTFVDWPKWTKVTRKPVVSKGHNNNWVGIYVDDLAKETYLSASAPYRECATIVKPIYDDPNGLSVRKLTIMVKMPAGYDPENGDWWYGDYDAQGTRARKQGKLPGCIPCHKQAAETDYLFSRDVLEAVKE